MVQQDKDNELVLIFKTELLRELGIFQGVNSSYEKYIDAIINEKAYFFLPRKEVETDNSYKQVIPYVIITYENTILHYVRGKGSGEKRLHALGSIGIGGHINYNDFSLFRSDEGAYYSAVEREVIEEINVKSEYEPSIIGVLNDDSNPVGEVHFGVIHHWKLKEPLVEKREKEITKISFKTRAELEDEFDSLESWSQLCVKAALPVFK
ncbi:hypothetical protein ACFL40_00305 [candidate division KSB1 bacterium]